MLNVDQLISGGGILLIALIIFAESGLLVGFFLPGDTLLFGAGLAASQGKLPLLGLIIACGLAAIIGDNVGYSIGRRAGPRLFKQKDGLLFRQEYLEQAEKFYEQHGGKTIILARFTPIIRTFAPVVAGAGKMERQRFTWFNIAGGILWTLGMSLLGYFVGSRIPHLDQYIDKVLLAVVLLSFALAVAHILRDKKSRQLLAKRLKLRKNS
jgi:membrane-associated protein